MNPRSAAYEAAAVTRLSYGGSIKTSAFFQKRVCRPILIICPPECEWMPEEIASVKSALDAILLKLSQLERRVEALERRMGIVRPQSPPSSTPARTPTVRHTYLTRAIMDAKRQYERSK